MVCRGSSACLWVADEEVGAWSGGRWLCGVCAVWRGPVGMLPSWVVLFLVVDSVWLLCAEWHGLLKCACWVWVLYRSVCAVWFMVRLCVLSDTYGDCAYWR